MRVLVNKLLKSALLSQFVANFIGFIANLNLFKILFTKNIANMHREHDVLFFLNIVKNIEVDVFFKHRLKMTSLRIGKHRIVKNIASLRKVNIAHP